MSSLYQGRIDKNVNMRNQNFGISDRLEELKTTPNLVLTDQVINDETCLQIADFMRKNDILTNLESTDSLITGTGLGLLADCISSSKTLKRIAFSKNQITGEEAGFEKFISSLIFNQSVESLDFSNNFLGDQSTISIANLISKNKTLQSINLGSNSIHNEGCRHLINALNKNSTLHNLNLENNDISNDLIQRIEELLMKNTNKNLPGRNELQFLKSDSKLYKGKSDIFDNKSVEFAKLEISYIDLKRKFEEEKINLDMCKNGYIRTIEIEKAEKEKLLEEIELLRRNISLNEEKSNQILEELKINSDNEKIKLLSDLEDAKVQINKLQEMNIIVENSNQEMQVKLNTEIEARQIVIKDYEKTIESINLQSQYANEENAKLINGYKDKIALLDIQLIQLKALNKESELKFNSIIRELETKFELERANYQKIQSTFANYKEKSKTKRANIKADLRQSNELTIKLQEQIELLKLEINTKDNEINSAKLELENECNRLKEDIGRLKVEYNHILAEDKSKLEELELLLIKSQQTLQAEKTRITTEERINYVKMEEQYSMQINGLENKMFELERLKNSLENENEKLKILLMEEKKLRENEAKKIKEELILKFQSEKNSITEFWGIKSKEIENTKDTLYRKNIEYIEEIKILKSKLAHLSNSLNDLNVLKEKNSQLEISFNQIKNENDKLNILLGDKEKIIINLEEDHKFNENEKNQLKSELSNVELAIEDVPALKERIRQLEKAIEIEKIKSFDLENELVKEKNYSSTFVRNLENERKQVLISMQGPLSLPKLDPENNLTSSKTFVKKTIIVPTYLKEQSDNTN